LVADRLLTTSLGKDIPPYEFESPTPKIIHKGNVGVGFAGSSFYADLAATKIEGKKNFDEIVKALSNFMKNEREKNVKSFIKRLTGVEPKEFFTNLNSLDFREYVYLFDGPLICC